MKTSKKLESEMLAMAVDEWKRSGGSVKKLNIGVAKHHHDVYVYKAATLGDGNSRKTNIAHKSSDWNK